VILDFAFMSAKEERGYYCFGYAVKQQTNLCVFKQLIIHLQQDLLLKLFLIMTIATLDLLSKDR
jgi:hypothetical protein